MNLQGNIGYYFESPDFSNESMYRQIGVLSLCICVKFGSRCSFHGLQQVTTLQDPKSNKNTYENIYEKCVSTYEYTYMCMYMYVSYMYICIYMYDMYIYTLCIYSYTHIFKSAYLYTCMYMYVVT